MVSSITVSFPLIVVVSKNDVVAIGKRESKNGSFVIPRLIRMSGSCLRVSLSIPFIANTGEMYRYSPFKIYSEALFVH